MIKTKKPVFTHRNGLLYPVNIEIIHIVDDFKNFQFKYMVSDYLEVEDSKIPLGDKVVILPYAQRDGMKQLIVSQLLEEIQQKTESELNSLILPLALLAFVKQDVVDLNNNLLIYGTTPEDWELKTSK